MFVYDGVFGSVDELIRTLITQKAEQPCKTAPHTELHGKTVVRTADTESAPSYAALRLRRSSSAERPSRLIVAVAGSGIIVSVRLPPSA